MLIIMDGWGHGKVPSADAIAHANAPFVKSLYSKYPNTELNASSEAVGLPDGQMGNSEVGHLNMGAGRIVYQELQRINVAIQNHELESNKVLLNAFSYAQAQNKRLHFMGLVSNGGVHSHINHLKELCTLAQKEKVADFVLHAFTDGRDTDPKSGHSFIEEMMQHLDATGGKLATVIGRYYAMDRDKRWDRVKVAYDMLVHGTGAKTNDVLAAITDDYKKGITDEFLNPIINCSADGTPVALIRDGDVVICFNFRTDRCREITQALTQQAYPEQNMAPLDLHYITMTPYDETYKNVGVVFTNANLNNTLGEVLANNGKTQIRIAETEKYPHVTFFFSGGREEPFEGERRIMVPSQRDVPTYDKKPEMSAQGITDKILPELRNKTADFICLNFANADMVGHTGVWDAVIKAVETVDKCVSEIVPVALENGYAVFLTADHGNAEYMINPDGSPNTAHTKNPVPFFIISNDFKGTLKPGKLGDLAPTILSYIGITIPVEMTGEVLMN